MPDLHRMPVFPLAVVLCPDELLQLHIFEERYKAMVDYCMAEEAPFGIILTSDETTARIGCTARVEKIVETYPDGRMDILVSGEQRFKLDRLYDDDKRYLTADIIFWPDLQEEHERGLRERAIALHMKLVELAGGDVKPEIYNAPSVSFVMAHNAGLNTLQKQDVLESLSENERLRYLVHHFEGLIQRIRQIETLRRKIRSNGHFKEFPPNEDGDESL